VRNLKRTLCALIIVCIPIAGEAADAGAMLHAKGAVSVDTHPVTDSVVVFPGNVIKTETGAIATLDAAGTTVTIQPETILKFASSDIYLDRGSLTIASATKMRVHVKCAIASPAEDTWTQFSVSDLNGTLQVLALKSSVVIGYGTEFVLAKATPDSTSSIKPAVTIAEGQQYNRYEREGCPVNDHRGAPAAASGGIVSAHGAEAFATLGAAGVLIPIICGTGGDMSPTAP
jgi:hypothetical protein